MIEAYGEYYSSYGFFFALIIKYLLRALTLIDYFVTMLLLNEIDNKVNRVLI